LKYTVLIQGRSHLVFTYTHCLVLREYLNIAFLVTSVSREGMMFFENFIEESKVNNQCKLGDYQAHLGLMKITYIRN